MREEPGKQGRGREAQLQETCRAQADGEQTDDEHD